MRKLGLLALAMLACPFAVQAQESVDATETEAAAQTEPPIDPLLVERINIRSNLQKDIMNTIVKSSPKERKMLLDIIATKEKARIRRENLDLPPEEQLKYEKPNVNIKDRKEMQKYFEEIFVAPMDKAYETPQSEDETEENSEEQSAAPAPMQEE